MDHLLSAGYVEQPGVASSSTDLRAEFLAFSPGGEVADEPSSSTSPKYSCKYCDYRTDKKSNHDSHTKFVHFKARDSCPECGKQIANLNQHLRVSHKIFRSSKAEQTCPMCSKPFLNLESHMQKAHNVKSQSEHMCAICFKTFRKKDHLYRHESIVHGGLKQTCQICDKEFANLDKHMKAKHSIDKSDTNGALLPCDYCSLTFMYKSELNSHNETVHAINNPDRKYCNLCCKPFANLAQHQKIVHNGVKNFKCHNCQKGFYDNRELRRHHIKFLKTSECKKEVTQAVCKFHCDFENCQYKTNKKGNMEMHKESVHLNIKYNCPECNKTLSSRANLNSHVKNVHDKKIVNGSLQKDPYKLKFQCKLCEYTTNRAMHLDRHMLSVHSAAAFETVGQVYQASREPAELTSQQEQGGSCRARQPQFASLVQVEGGQYLLPEPGPVHLVARRGSTELGSLPSPASQEEHAFQLVDNLPSIYFV